MLGIALPGFRIMVQDLKLRVRSSALGACAVGLGFRVQGLGSRV